MSTSVECALMDDTIAHTDVLARFLLGYVPFNDQVPVVDCRDDSMQDW